MSGLLEQLEAIKREGNYAVTLWYGSSDVGCDDIGEPQMERSIRVVATPAGFLGELRKMWVAKSLAAFLAMDLATVAKVTPNPPTREDLEEPGIYVWGTPSAVVSYRKARS